MDRILIVPRPRGDGWSLLTDGLALWYRDDLLAIEYAHHWLRESGGMVWVIDHKGFPVVSEFVPKGGHSVMAQAAGGRRNDLSRPLRGGPCGQVPWKQKALES